MCWSSVLKAEKMIYCFLNFELLQLLLMKGLEDSMILISQNKKLHFEQLALLHHLLLL